jgi:hypothetical protein
MGIDFISLFIWKYGLYIIIIWTMLETSCSAREGALPYHLPEFAPMYKEECYAENKSYWLCSDVNVQ